MNEDEDYPKMPDVEDDTVVYLDRSTTLPIPPSRVLLGALEKNLDSVLIIGQDQEGNSYYASSAPSMKDWVWEMRQLEHLIFSGALDNNGD